MAMPDITLLSGAPPPVFRASRPAPAPEDGPSRAAGAPTPPPTSVTSQALAPATQPLRENGGEKIAEAVEETNRRLANLNNASVRFEIHRDTGDVVIQVVDRETQELIRQIPPEEMLKIRSSLAELRGLLINNQG